MKQTYMMKSQNICTVESLLSRRLSLWFSPTGLDLGLMLEELPELAAGLHAAVTADPEQGAASMLVLFSTFALMVCRLRADGGGRSPKSFEKRHYSGQPSKTDSDVWNSKHHFLKQINTVWDKTSD